MLRSTRLVDAPSFSRPNLSVTETVACCLFHLYNDGVPGNKSYHVYIMSNQSRTLYVGVTNNVKARVWQHKMKIIEGFTSRYNIGSLVYVESFRDVWSAIAREKQIKRWSRAKKLRLIMAENPDWHDLSDGWYG